MFSATNSNEPWKIVEQFSDSSSGLSVTLFKNQPADAASPAKFCIAVRGTDNGPDYVTDLALALGAPTAQFDVLKAKVSQWFEGPSGVLYQQQVDACGHSLGGFLALSLKQVFSDKISSVYTYNSPGFSGIWGDLKETFLQFAGLDSSATVVPKEMVHEIKSLEGASFTAVNGQQTGEALEVAIEQGSAIDNHSIVNLTKSLALESFCIQHFGPFEKQSKFNTLLQSASEVSSQSQEALLSKLSQLLGYSGAASLTSDEAFYSALKGLQQFLGAAPSSRSLVVIAAESSSTILADAATQTPRGAAIREALSTLSFAAVVPPVSSAQPAYEDHSPTYWADRAEFLRRRDWFAVNDTSLVSSTTPEGATAPELTDSTWFQDKQLSLEIAQGFSTSAPYNNLVRHFYAADTGSALSGGGVDDYLFGASGADTLQGLYGSDWLEGGRGADSLSGGVGGDTYYYARGDGVDTITEAADSADATDVLQFGNVSSEDAAFLREGDDLRVVLPGSGGLLVKGWFASQSARVERFNFSDMTLTADEINNRLATVVLTDDNNTYVGTSGSDVIYALGGTDTVSSDPNALSGAGDVVYAGAGNDTVRGFKGTDRLYGGSGADLLYGGTENDTLYGEDGSDTLYGEDGADTLFGGAGQDTLDGGAGQDVLDGGADNDILDGGAGQDTLLGGAGNDTLGGLPGGLDAGSSGGFFVDPGAGNVYEGGLDNDTLNGTCYGDVYRFNLGDGADTIREFDSNFKLNQVDQIQFGPGISPANVTVYRVQTDLVLKVGAGTDSIIVKGWYTPNPSTSNKIEKVVFSDGQEWSAATLTDKGLMVVGNDADNVLDGLPGYSNKLYGGAGNDTLSGGNYADEFWGGAGNDVIRGYSENDIYHYALGDGMDDVYDSAGADTLIIEQSTAVAFHRVGNNLEVDLGSGQGVRVWDHFKTTTTPVLETLIIGGTTLSAADIASQLTPKPTA